MREVDVAQFDVLLTLIDEEIGSVSFVRDYFEVGLDGPIIRVFGNISLLYRGNRVNSDEDLFANYFRRLIGLRIKEFMVEDGMLRIILSDPVVIIVPITNSEYMHYLPVYGAPIEVWNGGDEA